MEMIMNETEMNQLGLFLETFPLEIKSLMFASTENIRLLSASFYYACLDHLIVKKLVKYTHRNDLICFLIQQLCHNSAFTKITMLKEV